MDFDTFANEILKIGGTFEDVDRLDYEGYESALDAHEGIGMEDAFDTIEEFNEYCAYLGRQFVIESIRNGNDNFHLSEKSTETE